MLRQIFFAALSCVILGASALARADDPQQPATPEPNEAPPQPPANVPPPPPPPKTPSRADVERSEAHLQMHAQAPAAEAGEGSGQWVYTEENGWLWMPYAAPYTAVDPNAGLAYAYVFWPDYGWRWVAAPWVFGWGRMPYWGYLGPHHFAWHSRPWFHAPVGGRPGWRGSSGFRSGGGHGGGGGGHSGHGGHR